MNGGLSVIVKTVTRWVVDFIFLYGLFLIAYGHLTPGGGFPGGVTIATAYILIMLAFGKQKLYQNIGFKTAARLDCKGALLFLAVALLGFVHAGPFFANFIHKRFPGASFELFSAGIIPICNIAIAVKVAASLILVAVVLSVVRIVPGGSDEQFQAEEEE